MQLCWARTPQPPQQQADVLRGGHADGPDGPRTHDGPPGRHDGSPGRLHVCWRGHGNRCESVQRSMKGVKCRPVLSIAPPTHLSSKLNHTLTLLRTLNPQTFTPQNPALHCSGGAYGNLMIDEAMMGVDDIDLGPAGDYDATGYRTGQQGVSRAEGRGHLHTEGTRARKCILSMLHIPRLP